MQQMEIRTMKYKISKELVFAVLSIKKNEDLKTQMKTKKVTPVLGKYEVMLRSLSEDNSLIVA